jgi:hypothetical protein
MKPSRASPRSTSMKLAIIASMIFAAGLWSGLSKSTGPLPDAPTHESAAAAPAHPVLTQMAGVLKIRF